VPQYELNLRDYLRIFRKRKHIIIFTFLIVTVGTIVLTPKAPPTYKATATIKIEERKTIAGLLTEWIVYNPGDVMQSEAKFITSFPVLMKVGVVLKAIPMDWFIDIERKASDDDAQKSPRSDVNIPYGSGNVRAMKVDRIEEIAAIVDELQNKIVVPSRVEEVNQIVSAIQGKLETARVNDTNMIRITATSEKPKEAVELANVVAEVYVHENLNEKNKQARHAREFIEEQLSTLETKLKDTENRLKNFDGGMSQVRLAEPIEQKLVELQFKLSELLQKYTEKHPQVIQIRDQIKGLESQARGFSDKQLEYTGLAREVEVNRKLYSMLKEKLEEARITEQQKVSDVSIVDPAVTPNAPISADNRLKIIMGAFMGLLLGVAFAFILETFDTSIGTIEDVENVIKLPVLGIVPPIEEELTGNKIFLRIKNRFVSRVKAESEERIVHLFAHYHPQSPITEAFRNIHTNLKLSSERKTILVTSSGPREGKSAIVCNLGLVMAQIGLKTLLVSTDMRRPIIEKIFGIPREPGLTEVIMGTAPFDSALRNITDIMLGAIGLDDIRKTHGIENIWILPVGHLPQNPVEIIDSKELGELIAKLKSRFDVILFDAPPVLPVTDANLVAPKVDGVIMVYEIGRTSREGLMRAKVQLEAVNAKILGVVLNHTQAQTEQISAYPYYKRYKYYSKEETQPKEHTAPSKKKA